MILQKRNLILTALLIIIIQIIIYINNSQNTSFRYFKWNIQEIRIGKLITISFATGLILSSLLNNVSKTNNINSYKTYDEKNEDIEELKNEEMYDYKVEMPPQRDIRDTQPTISVNYRVIKNNGENKNKYDEDPSNKQKYQDDWNNDDNGW